MHEYGQLQLPDAAKQALSKFPVKIVENVIGMAETFAIGNINKIKNRNRTRKKNPKNPLPQKRTKTEVRLVEKIKKTNTKSSK